ncbi:MAG TPA: 1-acyl-sn-glycerol-3-phosphate acyltransferase [Terriglobales bacterium]
MKPQPRLGGDARNPAGHLLSWARALLLYWPVILLVSLILAPVSLLAGLFDTSGRARHAVVRLWSAICLQLVAEVSVHGLDRIDPARSRLYVANHLSAMDIPLLYRYLPFQFRIMAHRLVFRVPIIGWWLRMAGALEIAPESLALSRRALRNAIATLNSGMSVVIFPEGERAPRGEMLPFKRGAFYVAVKAGVDVVPMAILGTYEAMPLGSAHLHRRRLQFIIGDPIPVAGYTRQNLAALTETAQQAVRNLYEKGG